MSDLFLVALYAPQAFHLFVLSLIPTKNSLVFSRIFICATRDNKSFLLYFSLILGNEFGIEVKQANARQFSE